MSLKNRTTQRISTSLLRVHDEDSTLVTRMSGDERETEPGKMAIAPAAKDRALLVLLTGIHAGQVHRLDERAPSVLGRSSDSDIIVDDAGVSRSHARLTKNAETWTFEDLGATNGSFVGGRRVRGATELRPGDRIQLGPNVVFRFSVTDESEAELQQKLFDSSTRDGLTQLYNRRYFDERLVAEIAYARRHATPLCLIMMDVDRFKAINDSLGHLVGDSVLRAVAGEVVRVVRTEDVVARYGGEELVVLARATGHDAGARLAERIRAAIADLDVTPPPPASEVKVTISLGVAALDEVPQGAPDSALVDLADERLYAAKEAGRNRIVTGKEAT
ncbi:MAG: diguanylate cyclase [Myxococcales bacterium]|nr:diguanylate cyclase [Myxococcales bacterium]